MLLNLGPVAILILGKYTVVRHHNRLIDLCHSLQRAGIRSSPGRSGVIPVVRSEPARLHCGTEAMWIARH
jgi:hypothetical protein